MTEPQLRLDPLTREWVTIAGGRQSRPNLPSSGCPFCVGGLEAPEPYEVRAFANRWPALSSGAPVALDAELAAVGSDSPPLPARGACEVVLYAPAHDASLGSLGPERIRQVIDVWAERTSALLERPEVEYVLVFENRGAEVGATIPHPHGQIYGFPEVPPVPAREAHVAAEHGCPLCADVPRERAAGERVVHDGGHWTAWVPWASTAPYGILLAPDVHVAHLADLDDTQRDELARALEDVVLRYDAVFDRPMPYMMWIHPGEHLHIHFAPPMRTADTQRFVAAGEVGSGMYFNPVAPETAAAALRGAR
ncbi:MAG: galactose-phosphate uridylyltransferase, family 1 [Thermoleophilia bacterium]|nr:galactose-phosphate uridylyltransferase, family 1 [Thermoleophilia bacterium]